MLEVSHIGIGGIKDLSPTRAKIQKIEMYRGGIQQVSMTYPTDINEVEVDPTIVST